MKRSGYEERNSDLALASDQKHCFWCKKSLSHRPVLHRNKHQQPEIIKFCSKECHNAWCYAEEEAMLDEEKGTEKKEIIVEKPKSKKKTTGKSKN
jgi:hypothetical protein